MTAATSSNASSLAPRVSLSLLLLAFGLDVLLCLGLILSALPRDRPPVAHRLLVLLNAPVVHVRLLRCAAESACLHLRQHLGPPEIDRPPAPQRPAPPGNDKQLVGARVLDQFIRLDERPPDL